MQPNGSMTADERHAYELGCRSFEGGDVDGALRQLTHLLRTRDGFADVHYMVGVLHERRDDFESAAQSLRRALRINPSYAEALLALANVYEHQGDFERSREIAQRAQVMAVRSRSPIDPTTRGKLANLQATVGDAYYQVGELSDAIDAYRKALDRCPTFHDIRLRLGIALREAGLPDRALGEFRRILRTHPGFLDAAVQLGLTLYTLGRTAEAIETWEEVLVLDSEREEASMYLRLVRGPDRA